MKNILMFVLLATAAMGQSIVATRFIHAEGNSSHHADEAVTQAQTRLEALCSGPSLVLKNITLSNVIYAEGHYTVEMTATCEAK